MTKPRAWTSRGGLHRGSSCSAGMSDMHCQTDLRIRDPLHFSNCGGSAEAWKSARPGSCKPMAGPARTARWRHGSSIAWLTLDGADPHAPAGQTRVRTRGIPPRHPSCLAWHPVVTGATIFHRRPIVFGCGGASRQACSNDFFSRALPAGPRSIATNGPAKRHGPSIALGPASLIVSATSNRRRTTAGYDQRGSVR